MQTLKVQKRISQRWLKKLRKFRTTKVKREAKQKSKARQTN